MASQGLKDMIRPQEWWEIETENLCGILSQGQKARLPHSWCPGPAFLSSCVDPDLPLSGFGFSLRKGGGCTSVMLSGPSDTAHSDHIHFCLPQVHACIKGERCPPTAVLPSSMGIKSRQDVSQTPLGLRVARD